jgi:translation elongation factor EF-4
MVFAGIYPVDTEDYSFTVWRNFNLMTLHLSFKRKVVQRWVLGFRWVLRNVAPRIIQERSFERYDGFLTFLTTFYCKNPSEIVIVNNPSDLPRHVDTQ